MMILLVLLAISIQSVLPASIPDDLVVSLPDGQVQGTTYTTDNNITFYGFQGIPFAAPPVGSLRFEAPQSPQPWIGVWDATYDRNSCFTSENSIYKDNESEDCLYINVFIPSLEPADEKLPVMVWIHGGGFVMSNADKPSYGPDFFIEEGVIVISLNYRLGPFGFLSTGDSAIVGNAGLKDQTLALRWAYDNVEYFGGDPDKITIFGESAGGGSTGLHLVNNKEEADEKLPVMVWIHGGGFVMSNADKPSYGPDFFIEEGVIVISLNYRLGPFGFLSTGDSAIVGNAGLKDQTLALRWAYDNVEYFGGDPDKITIFGESAGGGSTGLHLVNNKEEGLYRAAIVESGSAITNWTIDQNPKAYADELTTSLGGEIYLNDTQQLKYFLQQQTAEKIINAANLLILRKNFHSWPVIEVENEHAFITESPYEILDSGKFNRVPLIMGICANEALLFLNDSDTAEGLALQYDTVPETIIPSCLRQNSSDTDVVIKTIHDLYFKEGETFSSNLVALSSYFSDQMFTKGVIRHAELASQYVPVYFYQFSYYGRPLIPFTIPGAEKAGHGAELPFLFKQGVSSTDPADILTQNRIVRLWANFAKFLNPTPEQSELIDVVWPTITPTELQFLNINDTLDVGSPIREASYEGWKNIFETYGKKPIITF